VSKVTFAFGLDDSNTGAPARPLDNVPEGLWAEICYQHVIVAQVLAVTPCPPPACLHPSPLFVVPSACSCPPPVS